MNTKINNVWLDVFLSVILFISVSQGPSIQVSFLPLNVTLVRHLYIYYTTRLSDCLHCHCEIFTYTDKFKFSHYNQRNPSAVFDGLLLKAPIIRLTTNRSSTMLNCHTFVVWFGNVSNLFVFCIIIIVSIIMIFYL